MPLGQTPYIFRGEPEDLKRLFYSDPNRALAKVITIPAGYGVVKAGAVMGIITDSTSRVGNYVPYQYGADSNGLVAALANTWGIAYLVADVTAGAYTGYVTMDDSYKFAVGDHLSEADSDYAVHTDLGAITDIDRTTYSHMAVITVTNVFPTIQASKGACVYIQSKTTTPFCEAKGILKEAVNTGTGENAKGGQGVLVLGSAMLYKNSLYGYNSTDVLADRSSWREEDPYLIL